jgi:predicted branched-subunit amino acid permease
MSTDTLLRITPPSTEGRPLPAPSPTASRVARWAARDVTAVAPGLVPFGLALGVAVVGTGQSAVTGLFGAFAVFGGSAQLTAVTWLHLGAGLLAAVVSAAIVNLRVLLYGAAMAPRFREQPLWFRVLGLHFLQDQTYLAAMARPELRGREFRRYWGWLGGLMLATWTGSVATGLAAAPVLPSLPHLPLVETGLFVAMLVPRLLTSTAVVGAAAAALAAFATVQVAPAAGIVVGAAAGVTASVLHERRCRR